MFGLVGLGADAAEEPTPRSERLDALVLEHMEERRIPGASIGIVEADGTVHTAAYGTAVIQHDVPARVDTVYEIASLTKQFTAAAVLLLCDEGALDLDAPLTRVLDLPAEPWSRTTLRQLLTHTAGLAPQDREFASLRNDWRRFTPKELLLESVLADPRPSGPGEAFAYGSGGYFLAALAVERASGTGFSEFVETRILDPLGMEGTYFQDELRIVPHEAQGYSLLDGRQVNIWRDAVEEVAGGWGLFSTIPDLIRWDRALREGALLSAGAWEEMFTPARLPGGPFRYGLGWWLPERNGIGYQYHSGITGTEILRIPSKGLTVLVLTNLGRSGAVGSDEALPWGLADRIASSWIPDFALETLDLSLTERELASYEGRWSFAYGEARFFGNEGRLWIEDEAGTEAMLSQGEDVFSFEGDSERLRFSRDGSGRVVAARWFGDVVEDDIGRRISDPEGAAPPLSGSSSSSRPRIGLVLSGGGALGSAHVGVLGVLEELRIPIDFVVGTSMGALVGGLYASGLSPAEMEQILADTDWRRVLEDRPPRREISYRQKVDDQAFLADFEAGFNRGRFSTPPGLISGQSIGPALRRMAARTLGVRDFDALPIPFRAVATDLATGEEVVLSRGDLAQAMRASMSVPGIFSPIEIDDRLLVDGGLVSNLPVDAALEMGADVIVAVNVGQPLLVKEELSSLTRVTGQMLGLQMRRSVERQAARADVVIQPELTGYRNTDFERGIEMVPRGAAAARASAEALARFTVSEEEFREHLRALRRPRTLEGATVHSIQLTSSSTADPRFVLGQVETRPGDLLDLDSIHRDLDRLFDSGDFERIDVSLLPAEGEGSFDVLIEAIDKSWGPNYLRFGMNLVSDFDGESSFDLLTSYTMTRLNRRRAELKLQLQLGENSTFDVELYQPFSRAQTWFGALTFRGSTGTSPVPLADGGFAEVQSDLLGADLSLGLQLGRYGELRAGITRGVVSSELRSGPADDPSLDAEFGGFTFSAILDQFDNMNFPQEGYFGVASYFGARESLGSDSEYEQFVGFLGAAATRGRHTLLSLTNLYSALGSDAPESAELGGLFRLSGLPPGSVRGRYGGSASLLYLFRWMDLPTGLGGGLYTGFSAEAGNLWSDEEDASWSDLRPAGSVFVGADTLFGPLYLARGISEDDRTVYFFLGRSF